MGNLDSGISGDSGVFAAQDTIVRPKINARRNIKPVYRAANHAGRLPIYRVKSTIHVLGVLSRPRLVIQSSRMPKNIIICSDGTGNTAIKNRGTNVFKLFEAIDLNGHRIDPLLDPQVAFYDDGVGTETFLPLKLLGGAFGFGLAKNVRNLYMDLVRVYDPGDTNTPADRIYLFGFSRGAFTVRTLAGLIAKCGVLDRDKLGTTDALRKAVRKAYSTYRRSYRTWLGGVVNGILVG